MNIKTIKLKKQNHNDFFSDDFDSDDYTVVEEFENDIPPGFPSVNLNSGLI